MVISKGLSHISSVKRSFHLPANPCQVKFTHTQSSSSSSDSRRSESTGAGTGDTQGDLVQLPAATFNRVNGRKYLHKGNVCMWKNGIICCEHGRQKSRCKECGGSGLCEHGRQKSQCKECLYEILWRSKA